MSFDRLAGEFGDRDTSALRFMAQSGIEFIGQLHRRTLHGMPAYQGLAIVKRTIERRGGTVELVEGVAAGTAFRVRVPLADDPHPA